MEGRPFTLTAFPDAASVLFAREHHGSQLPVMAVTASRVAGIQNAWWEALMPILMVALIALAAFGLIGIMLALAATLEQKKDTKESGTGKLA